VKYKDLRGFLDLLSTRGDLRRVQTPVSTTLEMTEIADRVLRAAGPALLFDKPTHLGAPASMPVLANLFGTPDRVALGMGADNTMALRDIGELLASLKEPRAPKRFSRCIGKGFHVESRPSGT